MASNWRAYPIRTNARNLITLTLPRPSAGERKEVSARRVFRVAALHPHEAFDLTLGDSCVIC